MSFIPTCPYSNRTSIIRSAIASNNARIICLGDSVMLTSNVGSSYKGGAMMQAQIGVFGQIRAWNLHAGSSGDFVRCEPSDPTTKGTLFTYNRDSSGVTGIPPDTEFVGMPLGIRGYNISDSSWNPTNKVLAYIEIDRAPMASAVYPISGTKIAVRPLFYIPANVAHVFGHTSVDNSDTVGDLEFRDTSLGAANISTENLRWSCLNGGSVGAPVAGSVNRLSHDFVLTQLTGTKYTLQIMHRAGASTVEDTGLFAMTNPVFYEATGTGSSPTFTVGNYLQVLAGSSYIMGNMVIPNAPDGDVYRKCDTDAHWLQLLKVTAIDPNTPQQPVIVWRGDTEYTEVASTFPEMGAVTLDEVSEYVAIIEAYISRWDALCSFAGLPAPLYWFQQMPHHWHLAASGFGQGGSSASKDNDINTFRHNLYLQALYQVSRSNGRVAYTSMFAWFNGFMPDSLGGAHQALCSAIIDSKIGPDWVPTGTSYSAYSAGSNGSVDASGDLGDLLDENGLHSASADVERLFAEIMRRSLLEHDGESVRSRVRARFRGAMY